jgi:hypothetical protein
MMAHVNRGKVLHKVARYWPNADRQEIVAVLDQYGAESGEQGRARVQLAVLKLCDGRRERLADLVAMAKRDYRDVLAYAEYPEAMKLGFVGMRELSPEEAQAVRQRDREQYLKWLEV